MCAEAAGIEIVNARRATEKSRFDNINPKMTATRTVHFDV
jgi:hypothetical protein